MTEHTHTVHTDALATLGTVIDGTQGRDAIHLAVEPVIAAERLTPGQNVGLLSNGTASAFAEIKVGIVDPFVTRLVQPGERFWLVVYPRKITSLRHVWSHPAFDDVPEVVADKEASDVRIARARATIQMQADNHGITYDEMLEGAKDHAENGAYMVEGGRWEGEGIYNDAAKDFWDAYEIVTGRTVDEDDRGGIFSCSC